MAYNYTPSTYAPIFDMSSLFPAVDVTTGVDVLARPGQRTLVPDFLNQGWLNILNQIRQWTTVTYSGQKFTTLCYTQQGTTSAWQISLAFNGLSHPCQAQPGMQLRFPLITEIIRVLANNQATSGIGQTISIGPPNIVGALF
jgi:hypothetical protein